MKARAYVMGRAIDIPNISNPQSIILEVELDDGRTVQLSVSDTGHIWLRGWGNIPAKVGNGTVVTMDCELPHEDPTTCGICYSKLEEGCTCVQR